ncbi:MAG: DUF2497 domain-containing protein [Alphaproteobacteria bacterium]|nr:DUF2497 domain-containing protein [Alphaproteobacteria bacterium]
MANPSSAQADPSMEEILQSIRRIITEDDAAPAKPAPVETPAAKEVEDVLELTEVAEEPRKAPPAPVAEAKKSAPRNDDVMLEIDQMASPEPKNRKLDDEMLVSARVAQEATDAIANLMESIPRAKETPRAPVDPSLGLSVEDWLSRMLRPLLKTWLDENLPGIVRETVEREIRKIVR